jgi:DNA-binding XRE family transcriptional regulator
MNAAQDRSDTATPSPVRLRADVFDTLAGHQGAENEGDRARLVGIDRSTLYRIREGEVTPKLETALRMAERLGTTVDELFEVKP